MEAPGDFRNAWRKCAVNQRCLWLILTTSRTKDPNMSHNTSAMTPAKRFIGEMIRHPFLWLAPTVIFTVAAVAYTVWGPQSWQATQAFIVRDELTGNNLRLGRFESIEAMKTAQETIHEIARNPVVLKETMEEIGPPQKHDGKPWPQPKEVDEFREAVKVIAPNGAEFGKTEVLHLNVTASTRDYALRFAGGLMESIETRLKEIRQLRSKGIETELLQSLSRAQADVAVVADEVKRIESSLGADLGELRSLNQPFAGDGNLGRSLAEVKQELRQADREFEVNRQQYEHLSALKNDPNGIVATPQVVLASHPGLSRLKDGLVDAQLNSSQMRGLYKVDHPMTLSALATEQDVQQQVREEIDSALKAAEVELNISRQQVDNLRVVETDLSSRLRLLVDQRVPYSEALERLQQKRDVLTSVENDLAEIQNNLHSNDPTSLIAKIDGPQAGTKPLGPGKQAIVLGGLLVGFVTGIGMLMFVTAPVPVRMPTTMPAETMVHPVERQHVSHSEIQNEAQQVDRSDHRSFDRGPNSPEYLIAEVEHLRQELMRFQELTGTRSSRNAKVKSQSGTAQTSTLQSMS